MELLKTPYAGGFRISDVLYIGANALFVTVLGLLIFVWELPAVAFLLAVFSKWRILAVRPRYWGVNLRSNLPDLIFIIGTVSLAIQPVANSADASSRVLWLLLLAAWLIAIKPRSSRPMMMAQAAAVQFAGLTALFAYASQISSNQLYAAVIVGAAWLIGYAAARHAITSYDSEPKTDFFALLWGFIVAQIAWLFGHWLQVYPLAPGFEIPQVTLIVLLLSFCAQRVYALQRQVIAADDRRMRKNATKQALMDAYVSAGFVVALIIVILFKTDWTVAI